MSPINTRRAAAVTTTTVASLAIAALLAGPAAAASVHTVESGDTLSGIANRHGVSLNSIFEANNLGWSSVIYPGEKIKLNGASAAPAAPTTAAAPAASGATHIVVPGDTLSGIAGKYGVSLATLFSLNAMNGTTIIYPGQVIQTAGTKAAPAPAAVEVPTPSVPVPIVEDIFIPGPDVNHLTGGHLNTAQVQALVSSTASAMGVDPALALAIAEQESTFNQDVVSWAGAVGIMQVMPNSGIWASELVGRQLNLHNATDNATAGVAILSALLRTGSSFDEAIASYYQGQYSVQTIGMYDDTIAYVDSVKSRMAKFQ